jgi:hypothetical protein
MDTRNMTEKDLAIGVISMQLSEGIEEASLSFDEARTVNYKSGFLVVFPYELKDGMFCRKRLQLGDTDLEIAWMLAQRLHGQKEHSHKK